jgi:hypothetical protein
LTLTTSVTPSRVSSDGEVLVLLLQEVVLAGVVVDDAGQRRARPGQVRAAVGGVDGVGEGVLGDGHAVGVLQGHFHVDVLHLLAVVHRLVERLAVAVQIAHEGAHAALEVEAHLAGGRHALVAQPDEDAAGDEGHLAEAVGEHLEAVGGLR